MIAVQWGQAIAFGAVAGTVAGLMWLGVTWKGHR